MRNDHLELGNAHTEAETIKLAFHEVIAVHFTDFGGQAAGRFVVVEIAGSQNRLLANDTLTFNLAVFTIGIENEPLPSQQLHGVFTLVFDVDDIGKQVVVPTGIGIFRLVGCFNRNSNTFCDFRYHEVYSNMQ